MKNRFFLFPTWTENQLHGNHQGDGESPAGNRTSKNHVTIFRGRISNSPPAFSWQAAALISRSRQRHDPRRHQHFVRRCTDRTCRSLLQKVSWAGSVERGTRRQINSLMSWLFSKCFRRAGRGRPPAAGAEDGDVGVKLNQQTAEGTWRDGWAGAVEERANTSEDKCLNCGILLECCVEGQTGCTLIHMNMSSSLFMNKPVCVRPWSNQADVNHCVICPKRSVLR